MTVFIVTQGFANGVQLGVVVSMICRLNCSSAARPDIIIFGTVILINAKVGCVSDGAFLAFINFVFKCCTSPDWFSELPHFFDLRVFVTVSISVMGGHDTPFDSEICFFGEIVVGLRMCTYSG